MCASQDTFDISLLYIHTNFLVYLHYITETAVDSKTWVIVDPTSKCSWTNYRVQLAQQRSTIGYFFDPTP